MKNKKNIATIVMVALCVAALAVGTLALFTDRYQAEVSVTAGTVDLALVENWQTANSAVGASFKPGQGLVLDYTLTNGGNLAARVKETLVISSSVDLDDTAPEFAIYDAKDVNVAADGTVSFNDGAAPLAFTPGSYSDDEGTWHKLTYDLGKSVMSGSIEEIDTYAKSKTGNYVLVFSADVGSEFQAANLRVEYMAQGIQYTNTGDNSWNQSEIVSATVGFGGENISVVPELIFNP